MKQNVVHALYTLQKILTLLLNFVHKMKVVYFMMFLYTIFITFGQCTHSIIMHLHT